MKKEKIKRKEKGNELGKKARKKERNLLIFSHQKEKGKFLEKEEKL